MRLSSSMVGEAAAGWIGVVIDDELLVVSKSLCVAETVAVFASCPCDVGVTLIITIALAPTARLPRLQLTVLVPAQVPWVVVAEPNVTPAGSGSATITLVAAAGPLFVVTMR